MVPAGDIWLVVLRGGSLFPAKHRVLQPPCRGSRGCPWGGSSVSGSAAVCFPASLSPGAAGAWGGRVVCVKTHRQSGVNAVVKILLI